MEIQTLSPRGYCYGVVNAIRLALDVKQKHPNENIYLLGMIVHNAFIKEALSLKGIITLDTNKYTKLELIDTINEGIVILSAHGTSSKIKEVLETKNLQYYDATCRDVTKTQLIMKDYLNDDYDIIYIGKKGHPEAIAAIDIDEQHIHLICEKDDLDKLKLNNEKIAITNQTTLSIKELENIFAYAKKLFPQIVFVEEICNATRTRQEAVGKIDDDVDIVFIVGDPQSNNSNKLASIAENKERNVYLIESTNDIEIAWLKDKNKAAISSGASTPTYLTNMVINYLKQFEYRDSTTHLKPEIDMNKILD